MHPLLQRQIKKHLGDLDPREIAPLIEAVNQAYLHADEDRSLLERSIELSSNELRSRNQDLEARLAELRSTQDQLTRSYSLLRTTLDSTADAIIVVDIHNKVKAHNRQFAKLIHAGTDRSVVGEEGTKFGRQLLRLSVDPRKVNRFIHDLLRNEQKKSKALIQLKDGRYYEVSSTPQIQKQRVIGRVFSLHDITEKREDEETIRHQAYHDTLTGLPNRLLMNDRLRHAVSLADRSGRGIVMFFLDMDNFKSVNDRFGHAIGDQLLREVAGRLKAHLRQSDTVSRLGGDEFTVLLEDITDDDSWKAVASGIIDKLSTAFHLSGHEVWVGASIGVSQYPRDAKTAEDLLRHADMAMYEAKNLGRNRYSEFTSALQRSTSRNALIEAELRHAIERNELHLVYQAKFNPVTRQPIGFEALLRWQSAALGPIAPDDFINVAEQCGLIYPIGLWVLEEACRQLRVWHQQGRKDITIAVNISAQQFQHHELIRDIRNTLDQHDIPPASLEIEITESSVMQDVKQTTQILLALRHLGVALSIDDFGSGYSSMSYLKNLPVDFLKIDREFVRDIAKSTEDHAIVASMITLGHNLNLKVVAEGVEDEESLAVLKMLDCDLVQGFLLSRPLPPAEAEALLVNSAIATLTASATN